VRTGQTLGARALLLALCNILVLASTGLAHASVTPINASITQLGNGTSTTSMDVPVYFDVSGGTSSTYADCKSFFETKPDLDILLEANGGTVLFNGPISTWLPFITTTSVSPASLSCYIDPAPFGFNPVWPFASSSVLLNVKIYSGQNSLTEKSIPLYDSIAAQPKIQIDSPARGSSVNGDFDITFTAFNPSSNYTLISTSLARYGGLVSPCPKDGGFDLREVGQTSERLYSTTGYFATLINDHVVHISSLNSGNVTYCVFQTYKFGSETFSTDPVGINVNMVSPISNLSLDYHDLFFKPLNILPYTVSLSCPSTITYKQPTFQCVIKAAANTSITLGYLSNSTHLNVTGDVKVELCVAKQYPVDGFCNYGPLDVFVTIPLGKSVPVQVKNYSGSTGYTSVDISADPNAVGKKFYGWGSKTISPTNSKSTSTNVNILNRLNAAGSLKWTRDIASVPIGLSRYGFIGDYLTSQCGVWEFSNYSNLLKATQDGIFPESPIIVGTDSKTKHGIAILSPHSTTPCALVVRRVSGF